ncbi:MAG: DUF445 domain-containing protein [Treponema sp.]|jgi:uncharacterized membrane protein YheB (UPF0754 family)|nr:DUF445 domain-containing protein [Treponema sp.]
MKTLILLAVPPLVGALIGFLTNVVAIKMLFRPLREIRIFGIRLPFTPGVLPRQRHKLADNIGLMVERELLTPEIIRGRLRQEEVNRGIKNSIARYTEKILHTPLGELLETASSGSPVWDFVRSLFQDFLSSPVCDELSGVLSEVLTDGLLAGDLMNRSFRDLAGAEQGEKITALTERIIGGELIAGAEKISVGLVPVVEKLYPRIVDRCVSFLNRQDIRQTLEGQGRILITNIILKLNVFQRFFISTAHYDKTIHERMPEIVDGLIGQLEELLGERETRRKLLQWVQESLGRLFADENSSSDFAHFISRLFDDQMDKPLGHLLQNTEAGEIKILMRNILDRIRKALNRKEKEAEAPGASSLFRLFSARIREQYAGENLAGFFSLGPEKKDLLDSLLRDQVLRFADKQIAAALGTINVRVMVAERIDSLDMIRVERIVLDVMANQLKWIDIFGAILGFLIGLFQSLFSWFFR